MYKPKLLLGIARQGWSDMRPAFKRAFNDDPSDDRLPLVFGSQPRWAIAGLIALCTAAGLLVTYGIEEFPGQDLLNWPAVFSGLVFALAVRRYLFRTGSATNEDFPWLAAALIPAAISPVLVSIVADLITNPPQPIPDAPNFTAIGSGALLIVYALGVAAAFTIAVAALCYSKNWLHAILDLAVQLFIFKVMVWVTLFVMVEIGIVGPILAAMVEKIFGVDVPGWIGDFVDELTTAVILGVAYLAIIGAAWTVCRRGFAELLETGDVQILKAIESMTQSDKTREKKAAKAQVAAGKAEKKKAKRSRQKQR